MANLYATLNIQFLEGDDTNEVILGMEKVLGDAAINADADDFEIFYDEKDRVISIGVTYEEDSWLGLLEAGEVLGICKQHCMDSDLVRCLSFWNSINALDGTTIASPV